MKISSYSEELKQIRAELSSENFEESFINQATIAILKEMGKDRRAKQINQSKGERWKSDPATQKQKNLLDKFEVNYSSDLSKGKADKLIRYRISNEDENKKERIELEERDKNDGE